MRDSDKTPRVGSAGVLHRSRGAVAFSEAGADVTRPTDRIIDHLEIPVSDPARARAFYEAALRPLGLGTILTVQAGEDGPKTRHGIGRDGYPSIWLTGPCAAGDAIHIGFLAATRAAVDAFYKDALASGGVGNGAPGIRAHYHEAYYAAYVLDPDGNNIEAVCQRKE